MLALVFVFLSANGKEDPAPARAHPPASSAKAVVDLTSDTFESTVNHGLDTPWLVVFHSPKCSHCVNFKPSLATIAAAGPSKGFSVGEVNCQAEKGLCELMRVGSLPTLLLLKDNSTYTYQGRRTVGGVLGFIEGGFATAKLPNAPTRPPTVMGAFREAVQIVREELSDLAFYGSLPARMLLLFFALLFASMIGMIAYVCADAMRPSPKLEKLD